MKNKSKTKLPVSPKVVDASVKLVDKAREPFNGVERLTSLDRKRAAKLTRGAHQVIPTIAHIARKFAVEIPGFSIADMESEIATAQNLQPLLGAIADFHAALRDECLRSQSASWKTATVTYAMLRKAAQVNHSVASELEPVQKWFRHNARGASSAASRSTSKPQPATADTKPVSPANGSSDVVVADGVTPAHAG